MKHRLFKCGRLSGMLLGAAALLAIVPLMSVPALAEEPGAAYAVASAPAVSNSDGMDFTPTANHWIYYDERGEKNLLVLTMSAGILPPGTGSGTERPRAISSLIPLRY